MSRISKAPAIRPVRELKGFEKLALQPGETRTAVFTLDKRAFATWNTAIHDWYVETGDFDIEIARSSRDIVLTQRVRVEATAEMPARIDANSIVMDVIKDPVKHDIMRPFLQSFAVTFPPEGDTESKEAISDEMVETMMGYMPLRAILSFGHGQFGADDLQALIDRLNGAI